MLVERDAVLCEPNGGLLEMEKPMELEQGWQRLDSPELIQWNKPGETIAGVLLNLTVVEIKGKKVTQYVFAAGKKRMKCLATFDLMQKLTNAQRGMQVRIKYLGEDEGVKRNGNAMKLFDVVVRPDPDAAPSRDTGPITDDDVPF